MTALSYQDFLASKLPRASDVGIEIDPASLHPAMKMHQRAVTVWAVRKGNAAIWKDTGLGKSLDALEWSKALPGRTLMLAPLGVAQQMARDEGPKWGHEITYARSEDEAAKHGLTVTNYERLDAFNPRNWGKVILDEADILANFSGVTKRKLITAFRDSPYRLTLTATPAPNDTIELCNQADFLGVMPQQEMLSRFFTPKGVENSAAGQYKLKGHAEKDFYRWLATWAVACKLPSDLGFPDDGYLLPPLRIIPEIVPVEWAPKGQLFLTKLKGVTERAEVRRDTVGARVGRVVELLAQEPNEQWLCWYGLLDEANRLDKAIKGAVVLRGADTADRKADVLLDFARGNIQTLLTHPKIAGAGMNFQKCARQAYIGITDSYRQIYQGVRRSWRFGQEQEVHAHLVLSEPERAVYDNVLRKEGEAQELTRRLVGAMRDFEKAELEGKRDMSDPYEPTQPIIIPQWLGAVV